KITIVARQSFALPPLLQAIYDTLDPAVKAFVISDAYTTFFNNTLDNFESAFKGREFRIGRVPDDAAVEDPIGSGSGLTLLSRMNEVLQQFKAGSLLGRAIAPRPAQGVVDAHGFRHFTPAVDTPTDRRPPSVTSEVLRDLTRALRYDL